MHKHFIVGSIGEDFACQYLKENGYRIFARNVRGRLGELDIVARAPDNALVFVEVKTLIGTAFDPAHNYTKAKDHKTRRAVQYFLQRYPQLFDENAGFRIDLITVSIEDPLRAGWKGGHTIRQYKNI